MELLLLYSFCVSQFLRHLYAVHKCSHGNQYDIMWLASYVIEEGRRLKQLKKISSPKFFILA